VTTYAYSRTGAIIATEASGRVRSFAADSAEGVELLASGVVPVAYVPQPVVLTWLAFRARFTAPEQAAIMAAALANAALFSFLLDAAGAAYIDVTDPRTVAGVQALVGAGLVTSQRATIILTPPTEA
jgi:hypothetical protein